MSEGLNADPLVQENNRLKRELRSLQKRIFDYESLVKGLQGRVDKFESTSQSLHRQCSSKSLDKAKAIVRKGEARGKRVAWVSIIHLENLVNDAESFAIALHIVQTELEPRIERLKEEKKNLLATLA